MKRFSVFRRTGNSAMPYSSAWRGSQYSFHGFVALLKTSVLFIRYYYTNVILNIYCLGFLIFDPKLSKKDLHTVQMDRRFHGDKYNPS